MVKKKKKTPQYRLKYMEKEPTVSLHMPAQIRDALMIQSKAANISLSRLLLSIITNQETAAEARQKMVEYLLKKGQAQGYIECKMGHEETKNCTCPLCTQRKFEFWGWRVPQHMFNKKQ